MKSSHREADVVRPRLKDGRGTISESGIHWMLRHAREKRKQVHPRCCRENEFEVETIGLRL